MRRIRKNKQIIVHQLQHRNSKVVWRSYMDQCHTYPLMTKVLFRNSHPVPIYPIKKVMGC